MQFSIGLARGPAAPHSQAQLGTKVACAASWEAMRTAIAQLGAAGGAIVLSACSMLGHSPPPGIKVSYEADSADALFGAVAR